MAWQKKSTSPATFNLATAFVALITGDTTWGWLAAWAFLLPPDQFNTADFCAAGPTTTDPFSSPLLTQVPGPGVLGQSGNIAATLIALFNAAKDRVFAAYCEELGGTVPSFGAESCRTYASVDRGGGSQVIASVPIGATRVHIRFTAWSGPMGGDRDIKVSTWNHLGAVTSFVQWTGTPVAPYDGGEYDCEPSGAIVLFPDGASVDWSATACCSFNTGPPTIPYTPTPQPEPAGSLSPLPTVDPSLAGIADEVSRLEVKLDFLLTLVQGIAGATVDLAGPTGDPATLAPDTPIEVADAVGCIITASGIPSSRSLDFGSPQNVVKLGHVNFGTPVAWYPSIWLTHSPMVIRPFPPGTTRLTVTDLPPGVTVTISMIQRNK